MTDKRPLVSLVVPVYNEEENIHPLYQTVSPILDSLSGEFDFEFVFTDNHSTDNTPELLRALSKCDSRIRAYRFSRNFGYQRSILTAYLKCKGDAAIQLDCDLQDPPELIPVFLKHWREGYDVVFGIRENQFESWRWRYARRAFYWLVDALSVEKIPHNAGDFRLISRRVIEELRIMEDTHPYLRGTIATIGFKQLGVDYARRARKIGKTKFRPFDSFMLALDGIINQSIAPLRFAIFFGLIISFSTILAIIGYLIAHFTVGFRAPAGFTTITVLVLGSLSVNAMLLGIIGEYLGRMYLQMKKRSLTILERELHDE
jgi:polyisoprenyl-phosphate glycosyltransferase